MLVTNNIFEGSNSLLLQAIISQSTAADNNQLSAICQRTSIKILVVQYCPIPYNTTSLSKGLTYDHMPKGLILRLLKKLKI